MSMLPSIYLSNGGELGIVSLIKKFGSSSSVGLEVRRIVAISWFGMVYHPQHILAQKSQVAFC